MMKYLFIGGPEAGQIIDILHSSPTVQFPIFPDARSSFDPGQAGPDPLCVTASVVVYRRDTVTDKSGSRHTVYVPEGSGDPLDTLLEFYASSHSKAH